MTDVIPMFAFEGQQLRGVKIDGEPWFVANDVCRLLGLALDKRGRPNVTMACIGLDADETGFSIIETTSAHAQARRAQQMRVVSRPGLFKLIARSSNPRPNASTAGVRHEVLPHIMDMGAYVAADAGELGITAAIRISADVYTAARGQRSHYC